MQVLVTYNATDTQSEFQLCHAGVMNEVHDVVTALRTLGHEVKTQAVGVNMKEELIRIAHSNSDCIFNLCESITNYSNLTASFVGFLELLSIPFTGNPAQTLAVVTDKRITKALLQQHSIATPEFWSYQALMDGVKQRATGHTVTAPTFPLIVKPACEDGSIGIEQGSIVTGWEKLLSVLKHTGALFGQDKVIAERYLVGREFTVAFLGNQKSVALPISEMTFNYEQSGYRPILSYQMKWEMNSNERKAFHRICPAKIPAELARRITGICAKAYQVCGLAGYGRVDVIWESATDTVHIIDVNANPDITSGQGLPYMATTAGISYPQLVDQIIGYAMERHVHNTTEPWEDTRATS